MIDELTIQRIIDAANVVDVLSDFYTLKKTGSEFECLCPFHADKHLGSFKVSPRKNIYMCFSCGASGDSVEFLMRHEGLSFPDAIRWLGQKYGISVEGGERFTPRPCKPHQPAPQLPTLVLPADMPDKFASRESLMWDNLVGWLYRQPFDSKQQHTLDMVLRQYRIGHSRLGHTIFWQIDEEGNVRTGKLMLYREDGHRDKATRHSFDWVHSMLARAGKIDLDKHECKPTLFGMHLIDKYPDATIHIVESEKTAIIMSAIYGNIEEHLWLACGGLSQLSREKIQPLIGRGRTIFLHPDRDGIEDWKARAEAIGYGKMNISAELVTTYWQEEDGEKADVADVALRILRDRNKPHTIGDYMRKYPALRTLIEKLQEKNNERH